MSWLSQLWIEVRVRLLGLVGRTHLRDRIDEVFLAANVLATQRR